MSVDKKNPTLRAEIIWVMLIVWLAAMPLSAAGTPKDVDLTALIHDTQKQSANPDRLTMVWWLPEEFWEWSLSQDGALTNEGVEEILGVLRPYVMIGVVDGAVGPLGGVTFVAPQKLKDSVVLVDAAGQRLKPLGEDSVTADARSFVAAMKPVINDMLGSLGENLIFMFFRANDSEGNPIVNATTKGTFSVEVEDQRFEWKTPLGSLLPPKVCPVDDKEMSGAWSYCPWHGKKLVAQREEAPSEHQGVPEQEDPL